MEQERYRESGRAGMESRINMAGATGSLRQAWAAPDLPALGVVEHRASCRVHLRSPSLARLGLVFNDNVGELEQTPRLRTWGPGASERKTLLWTDG